MSLLTAESLRVSYSAVTDWRKCQQLYWYRNVRHLRPKLEAAPPQLGRVLHSYLECYYALAVDAARRDDPKQMHLDALQHIEDTYAEEFAGLSMTAHAASQEELAAQLAAIMPTARSLARSYFRVRGKADVELHTVLQVERKFEIEAKPGVILPIRLDMITEDRAGRKLLWEHKTTKKIPAADKRYRDLQTLMYAIVVEEVLGIKIDGIVWNYIRSTRPHAPKLIDKGKGLSRDKRMATTAELYAQAVKDNGFALADYRDHLHMLMEREPEVIFPRYDLPVLQDENVLLRDYLLSVVEIETAMSRPDFVPVRNLADHCGWCPMARLCLAVIAGGGDEDDLLTRHYKVEERKPKEEENGYSDLDEDEELALAID